MPTILVTGANGFIAAHCITRILSHPSHAPLRVRGTVRTPEKAHATRTALSAACGSGTGSATGNAMANLDLLVVSDPTDPTAMRAAMSGCDAVLHLASAFTYDAGPGEFEEKLLGPAVRGTVAVCDAAAQTDSVRKVVIMSSFAAVYDAAKGLQPGKVYTEEDWGPLRYEDGVCASIVATAYRASKVVAERAAWDFICDHEVQYKLITLCPGMVFGTMLHPIESLGQLNVSNGIVWEVLKGDNGIPTTKAPVWVDVDDLAIVSLKALTVDLASHERFLVTAGAYDTQEIADVVRAALPKTRGRVPVGEPGQRIRSTHYSCDSSKVQRVLGVEFKGLAESVIPLARQLYAMEQASTK